MDEKPINVASPLIANLLLDHPAMSLAVVMVQREVAERLLDRILIRFASREVAPEAAAEVAPMPTTEAAT